MDRTLSRPVTKLSRSTAVTTPNTICLKLGEPSDKSGVTEEKREIHNANIMEIMQTVAWTQIINHLLLLGGILARWGQ